MLIHGTVNMDQKYMSNYETQVILVQLSTQIFRSTIQPGGRRYANFSRFLLALTEEGLNMNIMIPKTVLNTICILSLQITTIDQL